MDDKIITLFKDLGYTVDAQELCESFTSHLYHALNLFLHKLTGTRVVKMNSELTTLSNGRGGIWKCSIELLSGIHVGYGETEKEGFTYAAQSMLKHFQG